MLLAGEGSDDLGRWGKHPAYAEEGPGGVIEALLLRIRATGWSVAEGVRWKTIRKYRAGAHASAEARNVVGLALRARDLRCDAVAFVRDRDGDRDRERDLENGIERARELFPALRIAGGVAIEEIEAWLLAIRGERGSESVTDPKGRLAERHGVDTGAAKIACVEQASLDRLPDDARSLALWIERARQALGGASGSTRPSP